MGGRGLPTEKSASPEWSQMNFTIQLFKSILCNDEVSYTKEPRFRFRRFSRKTAVSISVKKPQQPYRVKLLTGKSDNADLRRIHSFDLESGHLTVPACWNWQNCLCSGDLQRPHKKFQLQLPHSSHSRAVHTVRDLEIISTMPGQRTIAIRLAHL